MLTVLPYSNQAEHGKRCLEEEKVCAEVTMMATEKMYHRSKIGVFIWVPMIRVRQMLTVLFKCHKI